MTAPIFAAIILITLKCCFEYFLEKLNSTHVEEKRHRIPSVFQKVFDRETFDKANDYTLAKSALSRKEGVYDSVVLGLILVFLIIPLIYNALSGWLGFGLWAQAATFVTILFALSIPGLPFEWYSQFRLEESFGFNKTTPKLWISDKIKGLLLTYAIGVPLSALILWIALKFPSSWWIIGFAVVFGFQLLMLVLYPVLIVPLFNKLKPLEEGDLKDRLMALADRTGFKAKTIQVIDGSKRSSHSNAYFTGFGRFRRIVLFDTLIEQLKPNEIEAVLAHEIGHYRRGHIPRMIGISMLSMAFGFWLLQWLSMQDWFVGGFGFTMSPAIYGPLARFVPAFILFIVLGGLVTFWVSPLFNWMSRKHEYEADRFARDAMGSSKPLISALRVMYKKNLGNLIPHPSYSRFYFSHPTLREREKSLREGESEGEDSQDEADSPDKVTN
ncbi:MAG: M48 family metallopeptidase [Puniceicoccales bacterium]